MDTKKTLDNLDNNVVFTADYNRDTITKVSERLNNGGSGLSEHDDTAAAIINGRIDLLVEVDVRQLLFLMRRSWAHATIELIFDHWDREMRLPSDHPKCPISDQRILLVISGPA